MGTKWGERVDHACEQCGKTRQVTPSIARRSKYCSRDCVDASRRTRASIECAVCGTVVPQHESGTRYCSRSCYNRSSRRQVKNQSRLDLSGGRRHWCGNRSVVVKSCKYCGTAMALARLKSVCQACAMKRHRARRSLWRFTKRADVLMHDSAELIDPVDVFERDEWTCVACKCRVQAFSGSYDLLHAEMDHIIPVANAGAHTLENVQTMCRGCNVAKGNRSMDVFLSSCVSC